MRPGNYPITAFFLVAAILLGVSQTAALENLVPKVTRKIIRENNRPKKFNITARCPQIVGSAAFNRRAEQIVRQNIADFKKDAGPAMRGGRVRVLDIGYVVSLVTDDLISIGFGAEWDTGGAHPNSYSFVLNYDLAHGRELALRNLFKPNSNYLRAVSDYCIKQLMKEDLDREWVGTGAGPDPKNYRSWRIKRNGIEITFDDYQVASHADGPKEVLVPYSIIRNYVGSSSPISAFVKLPEVRE